MLTHARWTLVLCLVGSLIVTCGASAAVTKPSQDWTTIKAEKVTQGWVEIAPDVLERRLGDRVQHLGYGQQGLALIVGELRQRLAFLEETQQVNPTDDVEQAIKTVSEALAKARLDLAAGAATARPAAPSPDCYVAWNAFPDAYPLSDPQQGVGATASAYVYNDCGYLGQVYAYAHGHATLNGVYNSVTQIDGERVGTSVSAYANVTVYGDGACYSEALAYARIPALWINATEFRSNSLCPPPPPRVVISGTNYEYFTYFACRTRTWTATVTGGTSPYSLTWQRDGSVVGSGNSYTGTVCGYDASFNLQVTVSDSAGQSAWDDHYVEVVYYEPDPCGLYGCCFTGGAGLLPVCP